jgi:hypothetical protein
MLEEYTNKELILELIERGAYEIENEGQAVIYTGVYPE